jgi:tRNA pseudouridine38-40 synthase
MNLTCRNPGTPTIEEELLKALDACGAIAPEWRDNPQKAFFQRASRTDKGVSAVKMIVSLKLRK